MYLFYESVDIPVTLLFRVEFFVLLAEIADVFAKRKMNV